MRYGTPFARKEYWWLSVPTDLVKLNPWLGLTQALKGEKRDAYHKGFLGPDKPHRRRLFDEYGEDYKIHQEGA